MEGVQRSLLERARNSTLLDLVSAKREKICYKRGAGLRNDVAWRGPTKETDEEYDSYSDRK